MKEKELVIVNRKLLPGDYLLKEVFPNVLSFDIVKESFPDKDEREALYESVGVHVTGKRMEIRVADEDGTIIIGRNHLKNAPDIVLHLDIIHELVHVRQHRDGRPLYDTAKSYVDRETEIEAYIITLKEAGRLGLTNREISNYLTLEWITADEHKRLLKHLNIFDNGDH